MDLPTAPALPATDPAPAERSVQDPPASPVPPPLPPPLPPLDALWLALQAPPRPRAAHLGQALVERGLLQPDLLERALQAQRQSHPHRLLGQMLVESGLVGERQLEQALVQWLGVHVVDLRGLQPEPTALKLVPQAVAERESVLPLMLRDDAIVVAVADPFDKRLRDELRFLCDRRVLVVAAAAGTLAPAVAAAYRRPPPGPAGAAARAVEAHSTAPPRLAGGRSLDELAAELQAHAASDAAADPGVVSESDNTLVRLVNRLIADAVALRASDIHIETAEPPRPVVVRLRVDGELVRHLELPAQVRFALVARLKIMAELDISEHRRPQDGKIDFARYGGPHVELRMVTVPTSRGLEDVVLRLLGGLKPMPLHEIGLAPPNLAALRGLMKKAYGLILVCGPTGCGKTTTLHSVMRELNTERRKIWTAEDPIEITQDGLRQVQMNARIGWTFAAAMRTFLRADPDVIMVGEMRDQETARIAVEASLTGHLVLSTLHTNSAPESITRLLEMGLDPFMFSDSLLGILAQRLVRRLCLHCRAPEPMDDAALHALTGPWLESASGSGPGHDALVARWQQQHAGADGRLVLWRRRGCAHCDGSGYRGRIGIHELMLADEAVRQAVRRRAPAAEIQALALSGGMVTLRQDGIEKVLAGHTDLAEVLAAANQ